MGFSEKLLLNNEKIEHQTKLQWSFAFSKSGSGILFGSILAFGFGWSALGGFLILYGIACFPFELINYKTSYFIITSQRVLVRTGLIKRRSVELLLSKVEGVYYEDGLLERMNKAGHIVISGTGGTKEVLPYIEHPLEFKRVLQEKIQSAQKAG